MVRFLSEEWLGELGAAATRALADRSPAAEIVVEHVVHGAPDGEVRYHTVIDSGGVRFVPGPAEKPDATFREDYSTAAGLAAGTLSAQEAFFSGLVKVSGNTAVLVNNQELLALVADAVATVRDSTEFDEAR